MKIVTFLYVTDKLIVSKLKVYLKLSHKKVFVIVLLNEKQNIRYKITLFAKIDICATE